MNQLIEKFLGELERKEARLLSWGVVDGFWEEDELEATAESFLEREEGWSQFSDAYDFIDELVQQSLLFRLPVGGETRYRTRFA